MIPVLILAVFLSGCTVPTQPVCGNFICESGEDSLTCAEDCGFVGDGSLATDLYVETIGVGATTGIGYVEVIRGPDVGVPSAQETYNEGETINGLIGGGSYAGQEVSVKVVQIIQTGPSSDSYEATFELYDSSSSLIDTKTVSAGTNLASVFSSVGTTLETYNENEFIVGLMGENQYSGEEMSVKFVQVVQTGAGNSSFIATFELYDSSSNLVDTKTVSVGEQLNAVFLDSSGDFALDTLVRIYTIGVGATTGIGYIEVAVLR
ncbi:MAG: hypothetical protein CL944_00190 [Candidatus Diapherotrites archaeon]|uniref:Uncharacterized protein n=1 Tax=Candidatus Iainarchaeum sp. TaxID=3101447 RepID=A0A2D6LNX8_9ARCH|nr:hypothetical protein [Candidatus Diapherotrites archaeon]